MGKQQAISASERTYQVWGWVALAWALYRYFFRFPEWVDEFLVKPAVFIAPIVWYVTSIEKRNLSSLGLSTKGIFKNLYIGFGFGFLFALEGFVSNAIKYKSIQIAPLDAFTQYGLGMMLLLSLATAISEEILSRGFVFTRLLEAKRGIWFSATVSTLLFVLLHVPILVLSLKLQGASLILFFVTDFILGFANSLLLFNTGSLVAPILIHVFWNMTVALYL